jgi:hypothetical protein
MVAPGIKIEGGINIGGGIHVGLPNPGLTIATNSDGGTIGWSAQSASIAYSATVIGNYPVGSTITFQDNTTATITQWDDYGPLYIDIFWNNSKTGTIFPITLTT